MANKQSFVQRNEGAEGTAFYHKPDSAGDPICGSTNYALASVIQSLIRASDFNGAVNQIDKCIVHRQYVMDREYGGGNQAHKNVITYLRHLKVLVQTLETKVRGTVVGGLDAVIVKWNGHNRFLIQYGQSYVSGGRRRHRCKTRRSKSRKSRGKTRRGKTRRGRRN